jgi:hypothetical protein
MEKYAENPASAATLVNTNGLARSSSRRKWAVTLNSSGGASVVSHIALGC